MKKLISWLLALTMVISLLPVNVLAVEKEENPFAGKTISILGDSISTFAGVSNNTSYNSTIDQNAVYYTEGRYGISRGDTWWQQTIDYLGLELLVNNSWSGSCILNTGYGTVGAYVDRCVQLHNDKTGEEPDIIAVYLGTNDFCVYKSTLGTADAIDYDALITERGAGYTYASPKTATEAYAIMMHKIQQRYPNAEVYCFTLLPQKNLSAEHQRLMEQFNQDICTIAKHFDAAIVDLYYDSGIQADENFQSYIADNSLYPGPLGMDKITETMVKSMLSNSKYASDPSRFLTLRYDDRYDISGKTVEIIHGDAVVTVKDDYLVATDIGTAVVSMDGVYYEIAVEKAKINLIMVMGQSNAGNHFANATSDVTCPPGTAYWWGYGATAPVDYTQPSMGFHAPLLAELYAQSVAAGDPVKNVMIWEEGYTSKNGQSIVKWASSATNTQGTDAAVTMLENCLAYYALHSDKYEIVSKGVYWLQGESDTTMDPNRYTQCFLAMWQRLKDAGMEYLAFFRVREAHGMNTAENMDVHHTGSSSAQFEMVRTREDMFMATTITEGWTGTVDTVYSIDVSNYLTVMGTYGKSPSYSDGYGNKATYADGVLTTTMKELYGFNNKVHYGKFGYGLIGADAAYNMYRALRTESFSVLQTDTSGKITAQNVSAPNTTAEIDITDMTEDLSFRAACGSAAGTLSLVITSRGKDITDAEGVICEDGAHFGAVSVEVLNAYADVTIVATYKTVKGVSGSVTYQVKTLTPTPENCTHNYTSVVTPHTCTEGGYTTHTCNICGDTYVDSEVSAKGHTFNNGNCIVCGAADPDYVSPAPEGDWAGKTISVVGDSISAGAYVAEGKYVDVLGTMTGAEMQNLAVSGMRLTDGMTEKVKEVSADADLVIVYGGTNDYWHKKTPLGEDGSADANTYVGALGYIYNYLQTNYPNAEVLFVFPPKQTWSGTPNTTDFGYGTFADFRGAFLRFCKANHVSYIDLGDTEFDSVKHTVDGVHPNKAGHQLIAEIIYNRLSEKEVMPTPTVQPTATPAPTVKPTAAPTATPAPTLKPIPSVRPTVIPTLPPAPIPTILPIVTPIVTPGPIVTPTPVPTTKPVVNPFKDVSGSDWYYEAVMWAVENDVTGGTSANTFSPEASCIRAQVVTFLWAAAGRPEPISAENPFRDVKSTDWYYKAVLWAVENGITAGVSSVEFAPNEECTRAQVVTFLYAAAGRPEVVGANVFDDVSDSDWFTIPVIWARDNQVTDGIGDGKFGPERTCTRGQIVTFLYQVAQIQ